VLETLFEPFHRSKAPARGLGLGLYIAYQIAHAHGGSIHATTRDGKTCMRTTLPV
jgi:signal transduction histidine kinase